MLDVTLLDREQVLELSAGIDVEAALQRVLVQAERGEAGQRPRSELAAAGLPSVLGVMVAHRTVDAPRYAAKIVCVAPDNPARGLPAHQGYAILFDAATARPLVVADAAAVTEIRTAALTALATRVLAPPDRDPSLVIGAGHQAIAHLRAFASQGRPLQVWSRRPEQARDAADLLAAEGAAVTPVQDLEAAVRGAGVVTTVTGVETPIIENSWLRPRMLLNAIGSSTPRVCEVPERTLRTSRIVVDDPVAALELSGELSRMPAPVPPLLTLGAAIVDGYDRRGRTVYKSVGVPLQDLALLDALHVAVQPLAPREPSARPGAAGLVARDVHSWTNPQHHANDR